MARVVVDVMLKPEILDPQGQAVASALPRLGVAGVSSVRIGKRIEIEFAGEPDLEHARQIADKIQETGNILLLADVDLDQRRALERTGLLADLGADHVVWRSPTIGAAAEEAVRLGERWVAARGTTPSG